MTHQPGVPEAEDVVGILGEMAASASKLRRALVLSPGPFPKAQLRALLVALADLVALVSNVPRGTSPISHTGHMESPINISEDYQPIH